MIHVVGKIVDFAVDCVSYDWRDLWDWVWRVFAGLRVCGYAGLCRCSVRDG